MTAAEPAPRNPPSPATALQTIAHELRQPLGTIESIAYYLALVLPRSEARARDEVERLQHLVQQSNWILTCGMQLIDDAPLAPEPIDLAELIAQAVVNVNSRACVEIAADMPAVRLDPCRGRLLIENLLMLFQHLSNAASPPRVTAARTEAGVEITMTSAAAGHTTESSFGAGCGLSLASARRMVAAHQGTLDLAIDPVTGIVATVVLP
jgi:signal transduction histidine kinase